MNSNSFYYPISGLINAFTSITLGIFVLSRDRRSVIYITYSLFCLSIAVWSGFYFAWLTTDNMALALLYSRSLMAGAIFIPIFYLHHICSLSNQVSKRKNIILMSYLFGIMSLACDLTPYYIPNVVTQMSFKFWPTAGPLFSVFLSVWGLIVIYGAYLIWASYKKAYGLEKNRLRYVLIATVIGWTGGATNYPLWYGVHILPCLNILVSAYIIIVGYAIVRHQLMDIEVLIKKTLVFTSLFTIVFGIFVGIALLIQQFIGVSSNLLKFAISSLVIIFTVRPLEVFLVRITDKHLFQKKYDYKNLIKEFMEELKTMVLNTNDIAQSTVDFFLSSIRPASAAIFVYNKFTNRYDLVASSDFKDKGYRIKNDSQLIKMLGQTGKSIRTGSGEPISKQEQDQLKAMGIELIIPLSTQKELIGFLCLGKKKSDEDYTEDDIGTLSDLSGALSISLKNAQLFDERADAEKRALVGTIATGINHEVGNPLNIITIKLETFRILAQEGMMDHKSKDEIMAEMSEITKVCLDSAHKISEITKQVAEFAKPDRKIVFDKVNIGEAIDETITVLKHGMILDAGKIEKRFMCDPVYAVADKGQLKQILFNLIKNASHAITGEKGRIIVSVDKNHNGEIDIKVIDNGYGMSREVRDRVFTPFFTTKDPGKGTGLGLALVKIMVDRNDGRITVESQEGQGTTFTLVFKGGLL